MLSGRLFGYLYFAFMKRNYRWVYLKNHKIDTLLYLIREIDKNLELSYNFYSYPKYRDGSKGGGWGVGGPDPPLASPDPPPSLPSSVQNLLSS